MELALKTLNGKHKVLLAAQTGKRLYHVCKISHGEVALYFEIKRYSHTFNAKVTAKFIDLENALEYWNTD